jgi:dynein heavy chain
MDIFAIEQPPYKETAATQRDLELLEGIWGLKKEWQDSYSSWKDGQFKALDVGAMEAAAQQCSKRVTKLGRDIKTCARTLCHALSEMIFYFVALNECGFYG